MVGGCLGGATIATFQGIVMLCLAWMAHVPYNRVLIVALIGGSCCCRSRSPRSG